MTNDEDGNQFVSAPADDAVPAKKPRGVDYRALALARTYHDVLSRIARRYMTPDQPRRAVERRGDPHYGCPYCARVAYVSALSVEHADGRGCL